MHTMEVDPIFIAERCKYIRTMFEWTQENLADAAGLTTRTIEKVESGRHNPSLQTLRSIARALNFDMRVFDKPTPEQENRFTEELKRSLRKVALVPTSPIKTANDFYCRNQEWEGFMFDASAVEASDALQLTAEISDWITELDGIWDLSTAAQKLEYSTSIASLCRELEGLGYVTQFGSLRQQHMHYKDLVTSVLLLTFLPKGTHDRAMYAFVTLEDPWELPEQDRPKI
ncbi:DNA-binding transcriptional regulator, XRE-family HTH domain [Roseovarius pacificus]|uniref:DNA-binding transcriptional regulator, XRE-family HTH domain n=1 Tax=Roseovarius pacificus TaxID=337701 RepID=A0A1M6YVX3_9RHOB|nr:helix-turn-helix transcriptional regulator [Roseovarius pacificus]GGO50306.1 hypothetical protein GCM10011315_00760 [Roseovarius pacificus]SHL22357.1 DNA-binding transcriptional regulator, XRE-family HTH domain [Roseovarius pacificus]